MSLFHRNKQPAEMAGPTNTSTSQLTGDNTVAEWLDHPAGGKIFREMLQQAGQDESVLKPVHRMPMKRLIKLSRGKFTDAMLADMMAKANSGAAAQEVETVSPSEHGEESGKDEHPSIAPTTESSATPEAPSQETIEPAEWQEKITPGRFEGKTVIVTGAGSGIGKATASRVAREGGRVIAADINQDRLNEFKNELPEAKIEIVAGDITDDGTIEKIVKTAGDKVDALANVAGIMDNMTPLHEMTDDVWSRVMNVNLLGMMKLSRAVIPKMLEQKSGAIVNVGSEAGLKASAAGTAYTTSKHAVNGLSKSMAFMYGRSGIRTNVVAPGPVATNIEAKFESELGSERVNSVLASMPDVAAPEQLAASITFLLSDDSTNINGAILPSDGGWSVQ